MTSLYTPTIVPGDLNDPQKLQAFLDRELKEIAKGMDRATTVTLEPLFVPIAKPEEGMIVYADGVSWNPGNGEGYYGYINGAWTRLSSFSENNAFKGDIFGLNTGNDAGDLVNDIGIATGFARDATDDFTIVLSGALIKQLDAAWAVGTNAGMRASGAAIADTTYHIFLIRRPDTGVVDIAADTSATGANIAANTNAAYTQKRRIASIIRVGGAIKKYLQFGDYFWLESPTREITATNPGVAAVTRTLVWPLGISVIGMMLGGGNSTTAAWFGLITSLEQADIAPSNSIYNISAPNTAVGNDVKFVLAKSNTSAQVRSRIDVTGASNTLIIINLGWIDYRERTI